MGCVHSNGQTDRTSKARSSGYGEESKKYMIIDVAYPIDNNLILKRNEKLDNCSELRLELHRMWDKETCIVPINHRSIGIYPERHTIST